MAITAKFQADFGTFYDAVSKADAQLADFAKGAGNVETSLNRMADSFSGRKIIQEAALMTKAIEDAGGVSTLTAKQLQDVGARASEAAEKMQKLGIDVPPGLQAIKESADSAAHSWAGFVSGFKIEDAISHPMETAKNAVIGLADALGPVAIAGAAAVATFVAVGKAAFDLAVKAAAVGSELNDMAEKTGMSVPALDRLSKASQVAGSDLGQMTNALFMFERNMGEGSDKFVTGLNRIGLSIADLQAMSPDNYLLAIAEGLKSIESPSERAATVMELFGRQGRDIIPVLNKLDESLKMTADITPWTADQSAAAEHFEMQMKSIKVHVEALGEAFGRDLIPAASEFVDFLTSSTPYILRWLGGVTGIGPALNTAASAFGYASASIDMFRGNVEKLPEITGNAELGVERWRKSIAFVSPAAKSTAEALDIWNAADKRLTAQFNESHAANLAVAAAIKKHADEQDRLAAQLDKSAEALHRFEANAAAEALAEGRMLLNLKGLGAALQQTDFERATDALHKFEMGAAAGADTSRELMNNLHGLGAELPKVEAYVASFAETIENKLKKSMSGLNSIFQSAFEGGGNIGGAVKSFATDVLGGALSAIPAIGPILSQFSGAIVAGFSKLFHGVTQDEKDARVEVDKYQKSLVAMLTPIQQADAAGRQWAATNIVVRDAYLAVGRSEAEAQAAVDRLTAASHENAAAAKAASDAIQAVFDEQKQDVADLDAAVQKYGFSLEELGPKMQKQRLDEQAQALLNDWRLLVGSGIDLTVVNTHMTEAIQAYLTSAKATGTEVPAAMKPILQSMIDQGVLTDENGAKIASLSDLGVTFSETMTAGFDRVVNALNKLLEGLGLIPKAAQDAANSIPANPFAGWQIPDIGRGGAPEFAARGGMVTDTGVQYLGRGGNVLPFRSRGSDTVPAMLTPGEAVLNKGAVATLGKDAIRSLNRGGGMGGSQTSVSVSTAALETKLDALLREQAETRRGLPRAIRDAMLLAG